MGKTEKKLTNLLMTIFMMEFSNYELSDQWFSRICGAVKYEIENVECRDLVSSEEDVGED